MTIQIFDSVYDEEDLKIAWRVGNNAAMGFALGKIGNSPHEAVDAADDMACAGSVDSEGSVVAVTDRGQIMVVCDSYGPWAVNVSRYFDSDGDLK